MSAPRFSVVISTLDRVRSLAVTLDALTRLDTTELEVVVVEGPSTDGTAELLDGWSHCVKRVRCSDRNLAQSRNLGIRRRPVS